MTSLFEALVRPRAPTMRHTLRALALLLSYPDGQLRPLLPELMAAIDAEGALPAARRAELHVFADVLGRLDAYTVEVRYVETFDRGRATSLHLFEHVHGDSRERGPAMLDLLQTYRDAGLEPGPDELPDHLCVVLEFASTQPPKLARAFLGEMAHILQSIFTALHKRGSPYAAVVAAVLELAGERAGAVRISPAAGASTDATAAGTDLIADAAALDAAAADHAPASVADLAAAEAAALDESWEEPAAFDGCSTRGQARPGTPQPIHIVRNPTGKRPNSAEGVAA